MNLKKHSFINKGGDVLCPVIREWEEMLLDKVHYFLSRSEWILSTVHSKI